MPLAGSPGGCAGWGELCSVREGGGSQLWPGVVLGLWPSRAAGHSPSWPGGGPSQGGGKSGCAFRLGF